MLKINKTLKIPLLPITLSFSGIFLFHYLTFTPAHSSAKSIETIAPHQTLADIKTMQELTPQICANTLKEDEQYSLINTRDNQTYTVAKLKDNNCWMTQNMRYSGTYKTITVDVINRSSMQAGKYKDEYGEYYDWNNAINACRSLNDNPAEDTGDWQLPTKDQYDVLKDGLTWQTIQQAPYNFYLGGLYNTNNVFAYQGEDGDYWSSTIDSSGAYSLNFGKGYFNLRNNSTSYGYSVRCIISASGISATPTPPAGSIFNPTLNVQIPNILTMEVTNPSTIETSTSQVNTATFSATVSSNSDYSLSLNAKTDTSLVNIKDDQTLAEIPTITTTTQPIAGISSWGIRTCSGLTTDTCSEPYRPLPTQNQTNTFFTGTPSLNHQTLFQIGIGISPSLPSGTYSTDITVTVSPKS